MRSLTEEEPLPLFLCMCRVVDVSFFQGFEESGVGETLLMSAGTMRAWGCLVHPPTKYNPGSASVQITPTNVDIAAVAPCYHLYSQAEIEEVVSRL